MSQGAIRAPLARIPFPLVCAVLGLVLGWIPILLHGPRREEFDVLYVIGDVAVWGFYAGRCGIGLWIGLTAFPRRWFLRGPMCGFLAIIPLAMIQLAMPRCGLQCMSSNVASGTALGLLIAGLAWLLTGRHHQGDDGRG